jgi:hypothetical protein
MRCSTARLISLPPRVSKIPVMPHMGYENVVGWIVAKSNYQQLNVIHWVVFAIVRPQWGSKVSCGGCH